MLMLKKKCPKSIQGQGGTKISMMADFSSEAVMEVLRERKKDQCISLYSAKLSFKNKGEIDISNKQELKHVIESSSC